MASLALSLLDAHDNGRFWRAFLYSVIPQVGAVAALLLFGAGVGISSQIFDSLLQHTFYGLALVVGAFLNLAGVPIMASVGFHHGHGSKAVEPVAASRTRRPPPIFSISNMPSRRSPAVPILAFAF